IDIVYIGGYHTAAGLIARQMRDQGMDARIVSGDALVTREYWSIIGPAGEGTPMTLSPHPRKHEKAAPGVHKFRDKGIEPEGYVLYTYGAVQAWAQAAENAKSVEPDEVIKSLRKDQFDTVLGMIGFDSKGDITAPGYVFYEWKNGTYDYAE